MQGGEQVTFVPAFEPTPVIRLPYSALFDRFYEAPYPTDEDYIPPAPSFGRTFLNEKEYEREGVVYTKQQLKASGLFRKHWMHFFRQRTAERFENWWPVLVKVLIAFFVLAGPILLGLYLAEPFGEKGEPSMLSGPDPNEELGQGFIDMLKTKLYNRDTENLTISGVGETAKKPSAEGSFLRGLPFIGSLQNVESPTPAAAEESESASPESSGEETSASTTTTTHEVGVYDNSVTLSSLLPSGKGLNIFSFAYNVAVNFFTKTFGWENETTTGQQ